MHNIRICNNKIKAGVVIYIEEDLFSPPTIHLAFSDSIPFSAETEVTRCVSLCLRVQTAENENLNTDWYVPPW